jgi:hypothetical protein
MESIPEGKVARQMARFNDKDINYCTDEGHNVLMAYINNSSSLNPVVVTKMINAGLDINFRDFNQSTALLELAGKKAV